MSTLARRNGAIWLKSGVQIQVAASYYVNVYPVGGKASALSTGDTLTVYAGHGFAVGDKILIRPGGTQVYSGSAVVDSVTATTVTMDSGTYSVAAGDIIFNLGPDTSTGTAPNYDASPVKIYDDPSGAGAATSNSRVTTASDGQYGYWSKATGPWELVRTAAGVPCDLVVGAMGGEINPCDYGCAMDGSTDDAARFTAAILASGGAIGSTLELPYGKLAFGSTLTVVPRITIRGKGKSNVVADTAPTELVKLASLNGPGVLITGSDSTLEHLTVRGVTGNGGDGVVLNANSAALRNVSVFNMGSSGIRIGVDAGTTNCNNWMLDRVVSSSNTLHGVYIHHINSDANAGTALNVFTQSNGGDGFRLGRTLNSVFMGLLSETNTGWGINLLLVSGVGPQDNTFIGGDVEADNTAGRVSIGAGACFRNAFIMPLNARGVFTDAGGFTTILDGYKLQIPNNETDGVLNNGPGPDFANPNETYSVLSGGGFERLRVGWTAKTSPPTTGLVPAQVMASSLVLYLCTRDTASGNISFRAGTGLAEAMNIASTVIHMTPTIQSQSELRVKGDVGGEGTYNTITGTSDVTANSTGVGTIKFKGATARDSTGFIKIYIGTTAYYIPVFSAITG